LQNYKLSYPYKPEYKERQSSLTSYFEKTNILVSISPLSYVNVQHSRNKYIVIINDFNNDQQYKIDIPIKIDYQKDIDIFSISDNMAIILTYKAYCTLTIDEKRIICHKYNSFSRSVSKLFQELRDKGSAKDFSEYFNDNLKDIFTKALTKEEELEEDEARKLLNQLSEFIYERDPKKRFFSSIITESNNNLLARVKKELNNNQSNYPLIWKRDPIYDDLLHYSYNSIEILPSDKKIYLYNKYTHSISNVYSEIQVRDLISGKYLYSIKTNKSLINNNSYIDDYLQSFDISVDGKLLIIPNPIFTYIISNSII
jgi:hypothetical protein